MKKLYDIHSITQPTLRSIGKYSAMKPGFGTT